MTDLRISYEDLETTNATMTSLVSEFGSIQAQQSQYDWAYGSGDIAGAMGNFAGNWTYHRKQLLGNMSDLQSMVSGALTDFPKTDRQLASELTKKKK